MKFLSNNKLFLSLVGIALIWTFIQSSVEQKIFELSRKQAVNSFLNSFADQEEKAIQLLDSLSSKDLPTLNRDFKPLLSSIDPSILSFFYYRNDSLKLWSNNAALPPHYYQEFYRRTFYKNRHGSYLAYVKSDKNAHWVVSLTISEDYPIENQFLKAQCPLEPEMVRFYHIGKPSEFPNPVVSKSEICSLQEKDKTWRNEWVYGGLYLFVLLLLFFYGAASWQHWLILLLCHGSIFFFTDFRFPELQFRIHPFGDNTQPNLLDLWLLGMFIWSSKNWIHKPWLIYGLQYLLLTFSIMATYSLAQEADIDLHADTVLDLKLYSLLLLGYWAVLLWNLYLSFSAYTLSFAYSALLVVISVFFYFIFPWNFAVLGIFISCAIAPSISAAFPNYTKQLQLLFLSLMAVSLAFVPLSIDKKLAPIEAEKLTKELLRSEDQKAQALLVNLKNNLRKDAILASFYENPFIPKRIVEQRLEKIYLRGYLKKYAYELLLIPRKKKFGHIPDPNIEQRLRSIDSTQLNKLKNGFYEFTTTARNRGFLLEHPFIKEGDTLGYFHLLLKEKPQFEASIYPQLLFDKKANPWPNSSFALYKHDSLLNNQGEFAYPSQGIKLHEIQAYNDRYKHTIYQSEDYSLIETKAIISLFDHFIRLSIFFCLLGIFLFILKNSRQFRHFSQAWKESKLEFKIRMGIFFAVFVALIIFSIATKVFIEQKYKTSLDEDLEHNIKIATFYFEGLLEAKNKMTQDDWTAAVLEFSEIHQLDLDLFDNRGRLMASSQQLLYNQGVLPPLLDGTAYYELTTAVAPIGSQAQQVGVLPYQAAFSSVVKNQKIEAYLQLPYFSQQEDLQAELASFFVTLFDIYLLLLLGLTLFATLLARTLTRPMAIIAEKIKRTSLTESNEKIIWSPNDEIGLLVMEYNQMIDKLELSAKKLTESKQAEAWQLMAKQVAHEIKNPLTPMKLNIQQLQRAWLQKSDRLDQQFDKVTGILITQIDLLSKIATEFATFAKMPELKLETIDLINLLKEVATLYNYQKEQVILIHQEEQISFKADHGQLFRAINNLVKNGLQSANNKDTPQVKIHLTLIKNPTLLARIKIEDNGCGIEESQFEKIFLPNFSTKSSGMGMGLSIVKQIVENHNGRISVNSIVEKGSNFIIDFPLE